AVCRESSGEKIVEIANLNTPAQVVISGDPEAVEKASLMAKEQGAKRVIPLQVSGAFHSKLMEETALLLGQELDRVHFKDTSFPVVMNLTAKPVTSGSEIVSQLKRQIREKVQWENSVRYL